jgi:hypothetical protein
MATSKSSYNGRMTSLTEPVSMMGVGPVIPKYTLLKTPLSRGSVGMVIRTPIPKMTPLKTPVSFAGPSGGVIRRKKK